MKYFISAKYLDPSDGPMRLVSLGITSSSGNEAYIVDADFKPRTEAREKLGSSLGDIEAVVPIYAYADDISGIVEGFIKRESLGEKIEFWGWDCAHDWVAFCKLFGGRANFPPNFSDMCVDMRLVFMLMDGDPVDANWLKFDTAIEGARLIRRTWAKMISAAKEKVSA